MPGNNESTMKWKVDIAQLKSAMQDAKRSISLANAEFKTATASLGKWSNSITGVEAKIKQLTKTNENQKTVLANLEKQYDLVAKEMGEDSTEAQKLKVRIENQKAAIAKTESQLQGYNDKLGQLQSEQKQAASPLGQLTSKIDEQEAAVADLKRQYANAIVGDNPEEAARLAKEIDSLSTELGENKAKLSEAEKAADELDKSLDEAGDSAAEAANGGFTVMKGALANLAAQGIAKVLDGLRQMGSAIIDMGKQSLSGYAEYEQLVGGVDKLFGDASGQLQGYAAEAYKTAGMSANQYMQQVTSFSASLINSLGGDTAKAAEYGDMAMRAMSDNVNTFGSNMEDVQNAFQGFSKQNYTMLDNLKLGYGGTKEEMARLIEDANEYAKTQGMAGDLVMDSFADQVQAIELIQQKQGIAGTTAKEAANTMEGSLNTLTGAWQNFLVGLADEDADIDKLFQNVVNAGEDVIKNWLPRIKILIERVGQFISDKFHEYFPEAAQAFDSIVSVLRDEVIPAISDFVGWIVDHKDEIIAALAGIAGGLLAFNIGSIVMAAVGAFQAFFGAIKAGQGVMAAFNAVMNANPMVLLASVIAGVIIAIVAFIATNEDARNKIIEVWNAVKEFVGTAIDAIAKFFTETVPNALKSMVDWFSQLPEKISKFITDVWNKVSKWASDMAAKAMATGKQFLSNIVNFFTQLPGKVGGFLSSVISKVASWVSNMASKATSAGKQFINNVINFIKSLPGKVWEFLSNVIGKVGDWAGKLASKGKSAAKSLCDSVINGIKGLPGRIKSIGSDLVKGLWNGISDMVGWIGGKIRGFGDSVLSGLKSFFGIKSPSRVMRDEVGKMLALGIGQGFTDEIGAVQREMNKSLGGMVDGLKANVAVSANGIAGASSGAGTINGGTAATAGQVVNFTQNNYSPEALDRLTIYRDTNSLLFNAKVGLANV